MSGEHGADLRLCSHGILLEEHGCAPAARPETPVLTQTTNEHGTPVTAMTCTACGREFTVCPAIDLDNNTFGTECLADSCPSYDLGRDIGIFFEPAAEAGLIERRSAE